jgi:DNA-binding IclR family transcriptional regulator
MSSGGWGWARPVVPGCISLLVLSSLREKPLKVYEIMRRANVMNEESCQSLLLKMRDEGSVKFDIHKGRWFIG